MGPPRKAAGHQRAIFPGGLKLLMAGICVIDRSDTALRGSGPGNAAGSAVNEAAGDSCPGPGVTGSRIDRIRWRTGDALRRHWVLALLISGGLLLRVITQVAYQPALLFF